MYKDIYKKTYSQRVVGKAPSFHQAGTAQLLRPRQPGRPWPGAGGRDAAEGPGTASGRGKTGRFPWDFG